MNKTLTDIVNKLIMVFRRLKKTYWGKENLEFWKPKYLEEIAL